MLKLRADIHCNTKKKGAIQPGGLEKMSKMKRKSKTLTTLSAFNWIWESCARVSFVGNRHPPSRPEYITFCVLKVIIWLQEQSAAVSFTPPHNETQVVNNANAETSLNNTKDYTDSYAIKDANIN